MLKKLRLDQNHGTLLRIRIQIDWRWQHIQILFFCLWRATHVNWKSVSPNFWENTTPLLALLKKQPSKEDGFYDHVPDSKISFIPVFVYLRKPRSSPKKSALQASSTLANCKGVCAWPSIRCISVWHTNSKDDPQKNTRWATRSPSAPPFHEAPGLVELGKNIYLTFHWVLVVQWGPL